MNCSDVEKFAHAYVDGEFADEERGAFSAHLEVCAKCRRAVRFVGSFSKRLKDSWTVERAPASLLGRVQNAIDEEEQRQRPSLKWWSLRLAPVAAMAAVALFFIFPGEQGGASSLAEQTVYWHRQNTLPLDVQAGNPDKVRAFFADKVPFAVHPPRLGIPGAKLVGARLTNLREHRAAYLVYQVGKERISVFVVDPKVVRALAEEGGNIRWRGHHGYNVGFTRSRGAGYAVASEMDPQRLIRLISH
jgi:anti-sigma factor RsiW